MEKKVDACSKIIGKSSKMWTREEVDYLKEKYPDELASLLYRMAGDYIKKHFFSSKLISYEDMVQLLVTRCWFKLKNFDEKRSCFSSFVYMVMYSEELMYYRKEKKRANDLSYDNIVYNNPSKNDLEEISFLDFLEEEDQTPWYNEEWEYVREDVLERIKGTILEEYYLKEMNQNEIAQNRGISQSYVSSLIRKELNKLKKLYVQ